MPLSVALGIHVVDVLVYPVIQFPGGQSLAFVEQVRTTVAGSAAGTAIDMAKLGLEVYSIGAIGEDNRGDFLISTMQKFGVDTSGIVRKPQVETSCSVLPIRPNGERPVLHLVGASRELTIEDIDFSVRLPAFGRFAADGKARWRTSKADSKVCKGAWRCHHI
jgi:sugar/nucleoside kinase (ribokinase family)